MKKILIYVIGGIILLWLSSGVLIYTFIDNWNDRGTFGDLFGFINSLFSGLALAGLIFTIYSNRNELKIQREEIEINRKELIKSRKIQEKSERALEEQVRQLKLTTKLTGLQTLVDYFSHQISNNTNSEEVILLARKKRKDAILEIDQIIERLGDEEVESLN